MGFTTPGNFFCVFKIGDNVVFNLRILKALYVRGTYGTIDQRLLIKPKVIIIVAIIEAILHDFHLRMRVNVNEGVTELVDNVLDYVRGKEIDEFKKYIESSRKHDLFGARKIFYDKLEELRIIRNRVHIQNKLHLEPENEEELFKENILVDAEKCLELIAKVMDRTYPRPGEVGDYVDTLVFPWSEHFTI